MFQLAVAINKFYNGQRKSISICITFYHLMQLEFRVKIFQFLEIVDHHYLHFFFIFMFCFLIHIQDRFLYSFSFFINNSQVRHPYQVSPYFHNQSQSVADVHSFPFLTSLSLKVAFVNNDFLVLHPLKLYVTVKF